MEKDTCSMEFVKDENGKELLLKDGQFQVMMQWEKPYMKACIETLKPSGDVLEIGFGCGYSANYIQEFKPKTHTIIEYHPVVAKRAKAWALKHRNVTIVEDTWQNALDKLNIFDVIFFDDYSLENSQTTQKREKQNSITSKIIEEREAKIKKISNEFSFLNSYTYTDNDVTNFINLLNNFKIVEEKYLLNFLLELTDKKNITKKQFLKIIELLQKKGTISNDVLETFKKTKPVFKQEDRLFKFFNKCFLNHMKKGSRFSCFLEDPTSKYKNTEFIKHIISNTSLTYFEKTIPISVPSNCKYYKGNKALVILITKN